MNQGMIGTIAIVIYLTYEALRSPQDSWFELLVPLSVLIAGWLFFRKKKVKRK